MKLHVSGINCTLKQARDNEFEEIGGDIDHCLNVLKTITFFL